MTSFCPSMLRRAIAPAALSILLAGCGDTARAPESSSAADSSLARDLALAQRDGSGPIVFNDAPVGAGPGGATPRSPAPRRTSDVPPVPAPERRAAMRAVPRPSPRRASPPARVAPDEPVERGNAAPADVPAPAGGVIGAGTRVGVTTNGRVCAASALAGDKFTGSVSSATIGSNGAVIPAGSTVVLEVASVDRADPIEASHITFRVRAIDVNGVARPAEGDVATLGTLEAVHASSGNERSKVIGGAVAGAVLGRIFGRSTKATVIGGAVGAAAGTAAARRGETSDACLPDGSPLRLTLSRDLALPRGSAF